MRLKITKTNSNTNYYIIKDIKNLSGERTTIIYEKLGNEKDILIRKSPTTVIPKYVQNSFNIGYIFLEKIYYELELDKICDEISEKYKFNYDLNNILSRLLYSRIIYPSSKLATLELSKKYIEQPNFELHGIYRALEVIAKETDFIQSELYKNSLKISKRNTNILYYNCTNYFFEIEQESGLKQYCFSKEHRPNPIVQMELFMNRDGISLAFNIITYSLKYKN